MGFFSTNGDNLSSLPGPPPDGDINPTGGRFPSRVDKITFCSRIWLFPKIGGFPPNHPHFNRVFHYFHHPFWGPTIFGNTHFDWNFHWPIFRNDEWSHQNKQKDWGDSTSHGFLKIPTKTTVCECFPTVKLGHVKHEAIYKDFPNSRHHPSGG